MGWLIILGTAPIGVVGILAKRLIEGEETKNPLLIGTSLIVWALLLWAADRFGRQRLEMADLGWRQALIVGVAQVFALIPGSSRSGTTITGALFAGMSRETAARFSFLLSIPAIGASGIFELGEAVHLLDEARRHRGLRRGGLREHRFSTQLPPPAHDDGLCRLPNPAWADRPDRRFPLKVTRRAAS
jgi:undecaprenyl-diphosphatase UppP